MVSIAAKTLTVAAERLPDQRASRTVSPLIAVLPEAIDAALDALRQRMDAAGCVFDFIVRQPDETHPEADWIGEQHHRAVLRALFEEVISPEESHPQRRTALQTPNRAGSRSSRSPRCSFDLQKARPSRWDTASVREASAVTPDSHFELPWQKVSAFEWLVGAFNDPPYGAHCPPQLFGEFCNAVGLLPHHGIDVLDWVGDPDIEPERSNWSNYFDPGKQWWGVWCLTIWNPYRRTLAALAASATD